MSDFNKHIDQDVKQIYDSQTGRFEPVVQPEPACVVHADASEGGELQAPTDGSCEMPETEIRQTRSGGSTIVDFEYEKYAEVEKKAVDTDSTAALVLGILSLVANLFAGLIAIILGIFGIIFAVKGRRNPEKRGMVTAGLVCSIIGIVIGVFSLIVAVALIGMFTAGMVGPVMYDF